MKITYEDVKDLAHATADILDRDGWCQFTFHSTDGQHCLSGALYWAVEQGFSSEESAKLRSFITTELDGPMTDWNDQPGRTKEEVTGFLRTGSLSEVFVNPFKPIPIQSIMSISSHAPLGSLWELVE